MARPIRETPVLFGADAERFVKEMERVDNLSDKQRKINREKARIACKRLISEISFAD